MCGIAGLLAARAEGCELSDIAGRMAEALRHRGPDSGACWADPSSGIALAHRRLAIVDLSEQGAQPMASADGRFVIAYNGEIYNAPELRAELEGCGRASGWRGHSDTEVLLAAFSAWGVGPALQRLVGMFAFALWDRDDRSLTLARDRFGEKPLYYGHIGADFVFCSELKALAAHPRWRAEIDRDALTLFFRHACVPAPHSIFKGISKLRPGHTLTLAHGRSDPVSMPYWRADEMVTKGACHPFVGSDEEGAEELDSVLRRAVRGQMVADVPLGAFLSGGVDSSTVVALMQAESMARIRTFAIGFQETAYDEAAHAAAIARYLGTEHTELYVSPREAIEVIPRLPEIYDEPFADVSQLPTFLVARLASERVEVALSGDGGDELFGGYNRYLFTHTWWRSLARIPPNMRGIAAKAITAVAPAQWDRIAARFAGVLRESYRPPRFGEMLYKLAGCLDAESPDALYRRFVSHWRHPERLVANGNEPPTVLAEAARSPAPEELVPRMMYFDLLGYLPDDILVKLDRAAMAVSLETRVPFLDHRVAELAWRLPLSVKLRGGKGKWILRKVLGNYLPETLFERPKMGFGVPIDCWLRGPLRDWAEALLDPSRLEREGYLHPLSVVGKWKEHLSGRRNWQYQIWDVLMFQAWREHWSSLSSSCESPSSPTRAGTCSISA